MAEGRAPRRAQDARRWSASAKSAASRKAHYVAWFEPEHHIVELAAPFFARRFADMPMVDPDT